MAAGRVQVPMIIPLHLPNADVQLKNTLTTDVPIELKSETPNTDVFYTLNGQNPEPFASLGTARSTQKYRSAFRLPPGSIQIKAIAVQRDTKNESRIISRNYQVRPGLLDKELPKFDGQKKIAHQSAIFQSSQIHERSKMVPKSRSSSAASNYSYHSANLRNSFKSKSSNSLLKMPSNVIDRALASSLICSDCCAPRIKNSKSQLCPECGAKYPGIVEKWDLRPRSVVVPNKVNERTRQNKIQCKFCRKFNAGDARFCSKCGTKVEKMRKRKQCAQCNATVGASDHFCGKCGALLSSAANFIHSNIGGSAETRSTQNDRALLDNSSQFRRREDTFQTQVQQSSQKSVFDTSGSSLVVKNKPVAYVSAINPVAQPLSPGGGYWRQQLDHIASHLKVFAQAHKQFQTDVSQQRIGKLLDTQVDVNSEGTFSLRLDFELPDQVAVITGHRQSSAGSRATTPSSRLSRTGSSRSSRPSTAQSASSAKSSNRSLSSSGKYRSSFRSSTPVLSPATSELFEQLKSQDQDIDKIKESISVGADVNTLDRYGFPALAVAARNNFSEAIPLLVDSGANVNKQFSPLNNSALHEAAHLGMKAKNTVDQLLRLGADASLENKRGETAQEIALKYNHSDMADFLAAHLSRQILLRELH